MEFYSIQLAAAGRQEALRRFLDQIDGETDPHGNIWLSGKIAKGQIRKIHLAPGLAMSVWAVEFRQPVMLCKEGAPVAQHIYATEPGFMPRQDFTFNAFYLLTPEQVTLKRVGLHQHFSRAWSREVLLASDDVQLVWQAESGGLIHFIDFSISTEWYGRQTRVSDPAKKNIPEVQEWNFPIIKIDPCSSRDVLVTNKLFQLATHEEFECEPLKALSANMLTDLIASTLAGRTKKMPIYKEIYFEKIVEVEAILREHLQKTLPPLASLARQVQLSESTLKRYFKIFFGTSVYDYYLQKKMHFAKGMMIEKMLTVNEIADLMGYEKVSNFIDIFKKHHGFSPGTVKKKWMAGKVESGI